MKRSTKIILSVVILMTFIATSLGLTSIAVNSIKLNTASVKINVYKTYKLKVSFTPANATNKKVSYSSANNGVATVSSTGYIKGIKPGKTVITVTSASNKQAVAKCNVTITQTPLVRLSVKLYAGAVIKGSDEATFAATPNGKEIFKKLNIRLSFLPTNPEDSGQKLMIDMTSGNLPDLVLSDAWLMGMQAYDVINKGILENQFTDLTSYIKQYKDFYENIQKETLGLFAQSIIYNPDYKNKIYLIPHSQTAVPYQAGIGMYIRGDIAKSLNISTPDRSIKTTEDFYKLLVKIKNGKFKDTNGKDIYPAGHFLAGSPDFEGVFIRPYDFGGNDRFGIIDGKVKGFIESDYAWESILWNRKLVKEGLIDPESYIHKYEIGIEKMSQGRFAVVPLYKQMPTKGEKFSQILRKDHEEMAYKPLGNMNNYMGNDIVTQNIGADGINYIAIPKQSSSKAEAAIRMLNYLSFTYEGIALAGFGPKWEKDEEGYATFAPGEQEKYQQDGGKYQEAMGSQLGMLSDIGGRDNPKFAQKVFRDGRYQLSYIVNTAMMKEMENNLRGVQPNIKVLNKYTLGYFKEKSPNINDLKGLLDKMLDTLKQCYLAKTESEAKNILKGYVDSLKANGYDKLIDFIQSEYDKNKSNTAEYMSSIW